MIHILNSFQKINRIFSKDLALVFRTGVPHLFLAMFFTQGMGLIRRVFLARILSVPEMGQMTYVMQIADLLAIVADIGISTAVLKFAAEPVSHKEKARVYSTGLFWSAVFSSVISLLYMIIALFFQGPEAGPIKLFMLMVVPYIPFAALAKVPLLYMQAYKQIKRASAYTVFTRFMSFGIIVLGTYYFGLLGFFVTVTAMPLGNLVILLFATRVHLTKPDLSKSLFKKLSAFGFVSMLANTVGFANGALTVVLLRSITKSDKLVGYFSIALVIFNGFRLIPNAFLRVAFPYLSDLLYKKEQMRKKIIEISIKQLLLMVMCFLFWLVLGKILISFVFGAKYTESFYPSIVLMLTLIPFSVNAVSGQSLLILERVSYNFFLGFIQLATNLLLCWFLIPKYDALGASQAMLYSQSICMVGSVAVLMYLLKSDGVS